MSSFTDNFWGDNGFEVIMHNLKDGSQSSKDFGELITIICSLHKFIGTTFKELAAVKSQQASVGTFGPVWTMLRQYAEDMHGHYIETVKRLQDLQFHIQKYQDQQKDQQKRAKITESSTEKLVKNMRELNVQVQDHKKEYHQRCLDFEKARRANPPPQQKDLDKLEARSKKAAEEYRQIIKLFNSTRAEFQQKMAESCLRLQETEEAHLNQMKTFICEYFEIAEKTRNSAAQAEKDSLNSINGLTKEKLIQMFVASKRTGSEKPAICQFEEPNLSQLGPVVSPVNGTVLIVEKTSSPVSTFSFLRKRPSKKPTDADQTSTAGSQDAVSSNGSMNAESLAKPPVVDLLISPLDNDGFIERPPVSTINGSWDNMASAKKDDSDSDFGDSDDSDGEDEFQKKLRQIKIRPKNEAAASSNIKAGDISEIMTTISLDRVEPKPRLNNSNNNNKQINKRNSDEFDFTSFTPAIDWGQQSSAESTLQSSQQAQPQGTTLSQDYLLASAFSSPPAFSMPPIEPPMRSISAGQPDESGAQLAPPRIPDRTHPPPPPPPRVPLRTPPVERTTAPTPPLATIPEAVLTSPPINNDDSVVTTAQHQPETKNESVFEIKPLPTPPTFASTQQKSDAVAIAIPASPSSHRLQTLITTTIIPITFTFSETIDAISRGLDNSKCVGLRISGRLQMTLPPDIARMLIDVVNNKESAHPLKLRISPLRGVDVHHHKRLLSPMPSPVEDSFGYEVSMPVLAEELEKLVKNDSNDPVEIDIVKYKMKGDECSHACPLAASYKMQQAFGSEAPAGKTTAVHVTLRHRGTSICPAFIKNPTVSMTVGNFAAVVAKPPPSSVDDEKATASHITWQLPDMAPSSPDMVIDADLRFKAGKTPPPSPPPVQVTFDGEGHMFSGFKLDLVSLAHFRIAQIQKKFKTGRYDVEPEA